jgi:hypothetical protein
MLPNDRSLILDAETSPEVEAIIELVELVSNTEDVRSIGRNINTIPGCVMAQGDLRDDTYTAWIITPKGRIEVTLLEPGTLDELSPLDPIDDIDDEDDIDD